jgi:glycosyltransferase involved in cell wall biosynthesis
MDISFIIPARNEQDTLSLTVANLYRTVTSRSFEVIIVDDDSDTDLSKHIDPSLEIVYVRNSERLGVARSRNAGARKAAGDLLVFLDAHVCFAPGWVEAVCREREALANGVVTPAIFIIRDFMQFLALSTELRAPWPVRLRALTGSRRILYGYQMTPLPTPQTLPNFARKSSEAFTVPIAGSAALCVRRDVFFRLGAFEDELSGFGGHEDAELCMRCWSFGGWVLVLPSVHCFHYTARRRQPIDYASKPFHSEYFEPGFQDEQGVENALRMFYLHLPDRKFQDLLDRYKDHPGFTPDLDGVLTTRLRQRKELITERRIHDYQWLLRRMSRV